MTENRASLLIIDDEPINIRMLDGMLRDEYEVFIALNGVDAIKRALATLPDMILLDIQMNDMDGYQVCQRLKDNETTREIPVIFVTSMTDDEDERKGLELGAVDYITKPYRPSIIKARLHNHLELKRQRDLLSRLSSLDVLTGLANRRNVEAFLEQAWRPAIRFGEAMSLVFMDIDHFKKYNDNYNHVAGDKCLVEISNILKASLNRPNNLLARYHEDKFVCVLPNTEIQLALHVAEKMQQAILDRAIPHAFSDTSNCLTLSFGVASLNPVREQNIPSDLIIAADNMLYNAKLQGRNRIMS